MARLESSLFSNPAQARPDSDVSGIEILAASRQLGEIELIGLRIKRLLTAGGKPTGAAVRPGDVAVVFRSPDDVDDLVREVFGKLGIPVALESGQPLARSPALAALVALVRLDVDDWPFRDLLALLNNNYFQPDWPEWKGGAAAAAAERAIGSLQVPYGRKRLGEQLQREANLATADPADWCGPPKERSRRAEVALPLLGRLERVYAELPDRATAGRWAECWHALADETGLLRAIEQADSTVDGDSTPAGCGRLGSALPDRAAWSRLQEALADDDDLTRLLGKAPRELDRREALETLLDTTASVRVGDSGDESGRVRILSAASVRGLRIPYLFFAGLAERSFPPPQRDDRLYSEAEYQRLIQEDLPLVARTERSRDEMLLFYEVMTRASRRLHFSYPALDEAAQPLAPSPYLEEVEQACGKGRIARTEVYDLSPVPAHDEPQTAGEFRVKAVATALEGEPSLLAGLIREEPSPGLGENVLAGLRMIDQRSDRRRFGPTEGILSGDDARRAVARRFGPTRTFSATELEEFATCPYRFFVGRVLGIEPLDDLELRMDYLTRGWLVHHALADFHRRVNRHCGGPASPADLSEADYRRLMEETLEQLSRRGTATPLEAALFEVNRRVWVRWSADYRRQHASYDRKWQECQDRPVPTWFEVSFGPSGDGPSGDGPASSAPPLDLSTPSQVIRIAGRIDRIDVGKAGGRAVFNILDYKTGPSTRPTPESMAAGTTLQLPLYVMAAEELLAEQLAVPWRAGYWYVRDKGYRSDPSLEMSECRDDRIEPKPQWDDLRKTVAGTVEWLVGAIRRGEFPVHSTDEHCTRFCPFRTICRINHVRSLEKTWRRPPDHA
jgi:ATP-dependent helicase/DNAse subunit B